MKITVKHRDQYGANTYHPVCDTAKAFARIAKTKTLTPATLREIKALGYLIDIQYAEYPAELKEPQK